MTEVQVCHQISDADSGSLILMHVSNEVPNRTLYMICTDFQS